MNWKSGDWGVCDLDIVQIKELHDDGSATVSDGFCETSGRLIGRLRPLTLRNKNIVETFGIYYYRLRKIDGEAGFNYPDISQYFWRLALDAIDGDKDNETPFDKAQQFLADARNYKPVIDGIGLFRRNLSEIEGGTR